MSYEGRVLYMCKNGHVMYKDVYEDYYSDNDTKICKFCNTKLERVGGIDDTNCDSMAMFYIKTIEQGYTKTKIENGVSFTEYKPSKYELIRTNDWINFNKMSDE